MYLLQIILRMNEILTITANLTNTGKYAGTEVVQLYVRDKVGSVTRPVKELKGFQRIALQPGETKTVTFELPISDLAFWNIVYQGFFSTWCTSRMVVRIIYRQLPRKWRNRMLCSIRSIREQWVVRHWRIFCLVK